MIMASSSPPANTGRRSSAIACRPGGKTRSDTVLQAGINDEPRTNPREAFMATELDRRALLKTASGLAALPLVGLGSRFAIGAEGELIVRLETDIKNLDPANRVGSIEDNIIQSVCQNLARFMPGTLEWEPEAAKAIEQVSETEITFELHPGQTF